MASRFDVIRNARRFGHGQPVFLQSRHVESDGLAKFVLHGLHRRPGGNASRQVGQVGRVVFTRLFDDDRIARYLFSFRPAYFKADFVQIESNIHTVARQRVRPLAGPMQGSGGRPSSPELLGLLDRPVKPGDDTQESAIANRLYFTVIRSNMPFRVPCDHKH
jgi:hypothetical protein